MILCVGKDQPRLMFFITVNPGRKQGESKMTQETHFNYDSISTTEMLKAVPSEYWSEAREIKALFDKSDEKLSSLQKTVISFSFGVVYGEDQAISRIHYLEDQVNTLTERNKTLEDMLIQKSTQDVKQEEMKDE